MADLKQFGIQFGDRTAGNQSGSSGDCARCEAMLADAVDGMLSAADQEFFDAHVAECGPCAELLAASRRGAAWLEMLRKPAPEPSPALLEKILAQTAGATGVMRPAALMQAVPAMAPGYHSTTGYAQGSAQGNVIAFPQYAVLRRSSLMQVLRQPRMAMTAAMAFLSVALTMDLMGVNPLNLRASDLSPSSLKRAFFEADARVVQYYEGLRVVYEMESRLRDFENVQGNGQDNTQGAVPGAQGTQEPGAGQGPATPTGRPEGQDQTAPRQQGPKDGGPSEQIRPDAGAGEGHSERVREKTALVAMEQGAKTERRAGANGSMALVQRIEKEAEQEYVDYAREHAERRAA